MNSDLENLEYSFVRSIDDLDSFVSDLTGYISQMRSFISDVYGQLDDMDEDDSIADIDIDSLENIDEQANDLSYDSASVKSYVAHSQQILKQIIHLTSDVEDATI